MIASVRMMSSRAHGVDSHRCGGRSDAAALATADVAHHVAFRCSSSSCSGTPGRDPDHARSRSGGDVPDGDRAPRVQAPLEVVGLVALARLPHPLRRLPPPPDLRVQSTADETAGERLGTARSGGWLILAGRARRGAPGRAELRRDDDRRSRRSRRSRSRRPRSSTFEPNNVDGPPDEARASPRGVLGGLAVDQARGRDARERHRRRRSTATPARSSRSAASG